MSFFSPKKLRPLFLGCLMVVFFGFVKAMNTHDRKSNRSKQHRIKSSRLLSYFLTS